MAGVAVNPDPVQEPRDWDKAVSVAYLRILGSSQRAAANATGTGERTVRLWEDCSWWQKAVDEAKSRWLGGLAARARKSLETGVDNDPNLALKILERLDPDLRPPKERIEHSGEIGAGVLRVGSAESAEEWERIAERSQAALASASAAIVNRISGNGGGDGGGKKA